MTLPYERTNAVIETERFLRNMIDPKVTPGVPKKLRDYARGLLRHYPTKNDIDLTVMMTRDKMVSFMSACPFSRTDER